MDLSGKRPKNIIVQCCTVLLLQETPDGIHVGVHALVPFSLYLLEIHEVTHHLLEPRKASMWNKFQQPRYERTCDQELGVMFERVRKVLLHPSRLVASVGQSVNVRPRRKLALRHVNLPRRLDSENNV